MMIMKMFWSFGLVYMVVVMALLSTFMLQSDEQLEKMPTTPRVAMHIRIGAATLFAAIAFGALGTLGFLAQIWKQ